MDEDRVGDVSSIAHRLARIEARNWSQQDQEELAQEVLVKYWKEFRPNDSPDEPQAWLRVVTRTTAIDIARAQKSVVLLPPIEDTNDLLLDVLHLKAAGPSFSVVTEDFLHIVLDRLDPAEAQLIRWKYVEGRTSKWIADETGRGEPAARKAVSRAVEALRSEVEKDPDVQHELRQAMSGWYST